MNATAALSLIREIANSPGRLDKQAGLDKLLASDLGKFILKWTYDPFITFGITVKKMPAHNPLPDVTINNPSVDAHLIDLSTRALSGNAAKEATDYLLSVLDEPSREILFLILNKDLKAGIANTTIESVLPGFLPSFGVMRAHPYEDSRVTKFPVPIEPKLDGYRCTFIAKEGKGAFFTRSGKAIPAFQELAEPLLEAAKHIRQEARNGDVDDHYRDLALMLFDGNNVEPTFVLDGEALYGLFANMGAIKRKNGQLYDGELHAFDLLPLSGFLGNTPYKVPYEKRRELLSTFVSELRSVTNAPVYQTPTYEANSHEEIQEIYERLVNQTIANYLARGDKAREAELAKNTIDKATGKLKCLEGAMVKSYEGPYEKKKSYTWLKIKPEDTIDLFVVGFYNGKENDENENRLGGVIVDHKGVEVRIGGGWSSDDRDQLWEDWQHDAALLGIDPKVGYKKGHSLAPADVHEKGYKLLGRMLEIEFNEVTPDGSLRHPRAVRFRDDKAGEALAELKAAA
ncbi:putative ATP-dependent DNA ligase protein [Rhizobium phage RHEph10]|uniref:putative ATP-dependent DNA ligase protein n=1 Tax=Rhizobium phage RHEph10 TaxID=1220717 RepID=UPI0002AB5BDD|nr:putative ATP-dependent DNA ligase protein [Rhizobium phage RHEph10]AGC36081.1 putative ATP-dependent DNA ligase protein [Rhizobium phage RHEph10]